MKTIILKITKQDIKHGIPQHNYLCPIGLSLKRRTRKSYFISNDDISFKHKIIYRLPEKAKKFIERFDNNEPVKSFSFKIKI